MSRSLLSWLPIPGLREAGPFVPVLRLSGIIGSVGGFRRGLSLASLAGDIERAFAFKKAPAVALAINSPGGSPVQSSLIARRIRELADENEKPVYAFVEDVAASGGYWLACAADEIYADPTSIVGSIGVVSAGFGLQDLIGRYGIERRVYTAGSRKMILDSFQPERDADVAKVRAIQTRIHDAFKQQVRVRRGGRLKTDETTLFDGEFWTGVEGVDLGLIDGLGHLRTVLREKYGDKVRPKVVISRKGWVRERLGMRRSPVSSPLPDAVDGLLAGIEERLLWHRFGL